MKLLEREHLERLFYEFCQSENGDIYNSLVGITGNNLSYEDKEDQKILVDILMRTNRNGFSYLGTPKSTFDDPRQEFCHVISRDFNVDNTRHRLYFHFADHHTSMRFALDFTELCKLYKIPFYVKFDKVQDRSDGFVIYAEDSHLEKVVEILDSLTIQDPENTNTKGLPLTTYDCGWYGYGKESVDHKTSFNSNVATTFYNTIGNMLRDNGRDVTEQVVDNYGRPYLQFSNTKILKESKQLLANITPENADGFYTYFAQELESQLSKAGLLLNENTVPECISRQNEKLL